MSQRSLQNLAEQSAIRSAIESQHADWSEKNREITTARLAQDIEVAMLVLNDYSETLTTDMQEAIDVWRCAQDVPTLKSYELSIADTLSCEFVLTPEAVGYANQEKRSFGAGELVVEELYVGIIRAVPLEHCMDNSGQLTRYLIVGQCVGQENGMLRAPQRFWRLMPNRLWYRWGEHVVFKTVADVMQQLDQGPEESGEDKLAIVVRKNEDLKIIPSSEYSSVLHERLPCGGGHKDALEILARSPYRSRLTSLFNKSLESVSHRAEVYSKIAKDEGAKQMALQIIMSDVLQPAAVIQFEEIAQQELLGWVLNITEDASIITDPHSHDIEQQADRLAEDILGLCG